ncbi:MAG: AI-2E family transporter [Clostridia bacterium]|nr:AI-2E family transporter [Clostridia bacterium]
MRDKMLFISSLIFAFLYLLFIAAVFSPLREVCAPFITALILVYLFLPLVKLLEKLGIKSIIATAIVYVIMVSTGVFVLLYAVPKIYSAVLEIGDVLKSYELFSVERVLNGGFLQKGIGGVYTTVISATKGAFNVFVGFVAAFYILSDIKSVKKALAEFVPVRLIPSFRVLIDDVKLCLDSFFKGQVLIASILFVIDAVFLYVMKIPYAIGLAFIAAILDIIPYAGAFIAMGIIILVTLISAPGKIIVIIAGLLIIQQIENHIITPKISSSTLSLHPAVTVLALYVGAYGGFWGILLAVPLACIFKKIFFRFIQSII